MPYIGCHLSVSGGYVNMARAARETGADTFAFFVRSPRGGKLKQPSEEELSSFNQLVGNTPLVVHGSYTMNLCSDKVYVRERAVKQLAEDLALMEHMPGNYYNLHPGSHLFQGIQAGTDFVAEALNSVLDETQSTVVLIETMAGKGTELGRNFQELAVMLDKVVCREKAGICFDTCHVWDAGYDIKDGLDTVLAAFDRAAGLERIKAIHLNDSLYGRGSGKDRHARLGRGAIGLEALKRVVTHPGLAGRPVILETAGSLEEFREDIALVKSWVCQD